MSEIDQAVTFAILMQHGEGITSKAPSYILEKWDLCKNMAKPEFILDANGLALFHKWHNKWLSQPPKEP